MPAGTVTGDEDREGTTLMGSPTVMPHAAEGSSAEQFSCVFRDELSGSRTSASPPSPDHIVLSVVPAQFFPAAALWTAPLQGKKKKKRKTQQKSSNNDALVRTSSAP